jgi:GNAT superfamily N-acetyltransferase
MGIESLSCLQSILDKLRSIISSHLGEPKMQDSEIAPLNTEVLWLEAFPIAQALWPELQQEGYVRSLTSMSTKGYALWGIRSNGLLVGIAGVQEVELLARGRILWLFDMATHPDYQGNGFGARMLSFLQEYARSNGYSRLLLHTSATREATINFYRSQLGEPFGVVFRSVTGKPNA